MLYYDFELNFEFYQGLDKALNYIDKVIRDDINKYSCYESAKEKIKIFVYQYYTDILSKEKIKRDTIVAYEKIDKAQKFLDEKYFSKLKVFNSEMLQEITDTF